MYHYIMICSVNFVLSLLSENLENIECKIIKYYHDWITIIMVYCGRDHNSCKNIQKYEILNYIPLHQYDPMSSRSCFFSLDH
jgi:hypothetical protein